MSWALSLAGFQLILIGRIWVTPEGVSIMMIGIPATAGEGLTPKSGIYLRHYGFARWRFPVSYRGRKVVLDKRSISV
jgi:hypothetical protein